MPFVAIALLVLLIMALSSACRPTGPEGALTVGAVLPLTGELASYGDAIRKGMDLAAGEHKGDPTSRAMRIIYEDDRGDPRQALMTLSRLLREARVPIIIGGVTSSVAMVLIPQCERGRVALLSPTASSPQLTNQGRYFFRLFPSEDSYAHELASAAYHTLHLRTVAVLSVGTPQAALESEAFARAFRANGGLIVSRDQYQEEGSDCVPLLRHIVAGVPDAIYLSGDLRQVALVIRQARAANIKAAFIGGMGLDLPELLNLGGSAAEGLALGSYSMKPSDSNELARAFRESYRFRFRDDPSLFAALGFDAYNVLRRAVENLSEPTGAKVAAALSNTGRYEGVTGTFEFTATGDIRREWSLLTVSHGRFAAYRGRAGRDRGER